MQREVEPPPHPVQTAVDPKPNGHLGLAEALERLKGIDGSDPEAAHGDADEVLLGLVHPAVAEAYRAVQGRCHWWSCA